MLRFIVSCLKAFYSIYSTFPLYVRAHICPYIWVYSHTSLQYVGMFKSKRNTYTLVWLKCPPCFSATLLSGSPLSPIPQWGQSPVQMSPSGPCLTLAWTVPMLSPIGWRPLEKYPFNWVWEWGVKSNSFNLQVPNDGGELWRRECQLLATPPVVAHSTQPRCKMTESREKNRLIRSRYGGNS